MAFRIRDLMVGILAAEQGPGPCSCIRATANKPGPPDPCPGNTCQNTAPRPPQAPPKDGPSHPKKRHRLDDLRRDLRIRLETGR
jgi:hypothetical protein